MVGPNFDEDGSTPPETVKLLRKEFAGFDQAVKLLPGERLLSNTICAAEIRRGPDDKCKGGVVLATTHGVRFFGEAAWFTGQFYFTILWPDLDYASLESHTVTEADDPSVPFGKGPWNKFSQFLSFKGVEVGTRAGVKLSNLIVDPDVTWRLFIEMGCESRAKRLIDAIRQGAYIRARNDAYLGSVFTPRARLLLSKLCERAMQLRGYLLWGGDLEKALLEIGFSSDLASKAPSVDDAMETAHRNRNVDLLAQCVGFTLKEWGIGSISSLESDLANRHGLSADDEMVRLWNEAAQIVGKGFAWDGGRVQFKFSGVVQLEEVVGKGAHGTVWKAKSGDGVVFAAKLFDRAIDAAELKSINRELSIGARVNHPGLVRYLSHEVEEFEGRPMVRMEYLAGRSLSSITGVKYPVCDRQPVQRVTDWLLDCIEPLAHLHDQGVVHRDLHPGNILQKSDGRMVILDYGSARPFSNSPQNYTFERVGSYSFASPEKRKAPSRANAASDYYSVGVILYLLTTGNLPFWEKESDIILYQKMEKAAYVPPSEIVPGYPAWLDKLVARLLDPNPDTRLASPQLLTKAMKGELVP